MIDFLRANTWCSREQYVWGMSIGQIRLASFDFTHIEYLDKDKGGVGGKKADVIRGGADLKNLTDMGIPILN